MSPTGTVSRRRSRFGMFLTALVMLVPTAAVGLLVYAGLSAIGVVSSIDRGWHFLFPSTAEGRAAQTSPAFAGQGTAPGLAGELAGIVGNRRLFVAYGDQYTGDYVTKVCDDINTGSPELLTVLYSPKDGQHLCIGDTLFAPDKALGSSLWVGSRMGDTLGLLPADPVTVTKAAALYYDQIAKLGMIDPAPRSYVSSASRIALAGMAIAAVSVLAVTLLATGRAIGRRWQRSRDRANSAADRRLSLRTRMYQLSQRLLAADRSRPDDPAVTEAFAEYAEVDRLLAAAGPSELVAVGGRIKRLAGTVSGLSGRTAGSPVKRRR